MATTIRPTLQQGLHNPNGMQPLQGWSSIRSLPGAVPTAIEFVPFGDEIGRGLSFDTRSLRLGIGQLELQARFIGLPLMRKLKREKEAR